MNFDERIERLTERHEALTQSAELLLMETREIANAARENTENIRQLVETSNRGAVDIAALARIAESHERRITDIEGNRP
jgi:hypothetical protein